MRPRSLFLIFAVALAIALAPSPSSAQTSSIVPGTSKAGEISDYVSQRLRSLESGDPGPLRKARRELITQLSSPDADSVFRLQFSTALQQAGLDRLASSPDDLVAINAIVVAGELATQLSANILERASTDDRPAIRYEAVWSTGVMLDAIARGNAAIPANQIDAIFHHISSRFAVEDNVQVIDALIIACSAPKGAPELRARSVRVMCDGAATVAARWRGPNATEEEALTIFRAVDTAYAELLAVRGGVDTDFARSAAIASGQALTFLTSWLAANPPANMSPDARQLAVDLGGAAERVLLLAHNALTGELQGERITELVKDLVAGQRGVTLADVRTAIEEWTGARGRLHGAPYNVKAGAFD